MKNYNKYLNYYRKPPSEDSCPAIFSVLVGRLKRKVYLSDPIDSFEISLYVLPVVIGFPFKLFFYRVSLAILGILLWSQCVYWQLQNFHMKP